MTKQTERLNMTMSGMSQDDIDSARAAVEVAAASEMESILPPSPDPIDELKQTGKIAADFMQGMDKMTVVLMHLVMKFGRAVTMTKISLGAMAIGTCLFVSGLVMGYDIGSKLDNVVKKQGELVKMQDDLADKLAQTEKSMAKVVTELKGVKAATEETSDAAPRIVIDETTGKPKLVIQSESQPLGSQKVRVWGGSSAPKARKSSKGQVEFDLDF